MLTLLKVLFVMTFAAFRQDMAMEHALEAEAAQMNMEAQAVEIDIDDIKMLEKGEIPEKLQPRVPKVEVVPAEKEE